MDRGKDNIFTVTSQSADQGEVDCDLDTFRVHPPPGSRIPGNLAHILFGASGISKSKKTARPDLSRPRSAVGIFL